MKHKDIQKKLILYLDRNLSEKEMADVSEHLSRCQSCEKEILLLSTVWKGKDNLENIQPPDYLWTKLGTRLDEQSHSVFGILMTALRIAVITGLVIAAIFSGRYLGNVPEDVGKTSAGQYFWDNYNLESFEPIPLESIGNAFTYVTGEVKQ